MDYSICMFNLMLQSAKGYYVDTVGKNERRIAEYIRHQLDEDKLGEQLSIPETEKYRKKRK